MTLSWQQSLIDPEAPILEAIRVVDHAQHKVAIVVDKETKLLGVVTDGDIRRGILAGVSLEDPVSEIMNARPRAASVNDSPEFLVAVMRSQSVRHLPIIDFDDRVVGFETLEESDPVTELPNPVVLMAGGQGMRLRPLTREAPKPLLPVGERPILETIIHEMTVQGFRNFVISIRYLGDKIREHFGTGDRLGVRIRYIEESERLGTAGCLALLSEVGGESIVVANGDVLTKLEFRSLLKYHAESGACATLCVSEHSMALPYGVVTVEDRRLRSIAEKPDFRYLANAGIYVLSPDVLSLIPKKQPYDMTSLFARLISEKRKVFAFPIREYWTDVGRVSDLDRAGGDFQKFFQRVVGETGNSTEGNP
jgi:dTDP-glucose pyrophosphorylase